jgi:hypothetical protein
VSCDPGFADCDGNPNNGCEADLTAPATCGSCTVACGPTQMCTPTGCGTACPAPLTYCSGSCVDLTNSLDHCGACGTHCNDPYFGHAVCSAGVCGIVCDPGYSPVAGGTTCWDIANDPRCCGTACSACPMPDGGDAVCNAGGCGMVCEPGMVVCSGACVDPQRDVANCGGCGVPCSGICTGGICDANAKQIIATGSGAIAALATDGTSVFWIDGAGNVMQVDRAGLGAPITLATGQQDTWHWMATSAAAPSVYWTNFTNAGIWMATKGTPGANFVAAVASRYIAVNSSYVYYGGDYQWADIYRLPFGGGTPQNVVHLTQPMFGDAFVAEYFDVDDTYLYVSETPLIAGTGWAWVFRYNLDGTNQAVNFCAVPNANGKTFAIGGGMVGCVAWSGTVTAAAASTLKLTGDLYLGSATPAVAVDATYVYFPSTVEAQGAKWPVSTPGLLRAAICGGPVERIGPVPSTATAADDLWIYWGDSTGAIHRIAR